TSGLCAIATSGLCAIATSGLCAIATSGLCATATSGAMCNSNKWLRNLNKKIIMTIFNKVVGLALFLAICLIASSDARPMPEPILNSYTIGNGNSYLSGNQANGNGYRNGNQGNGNVSGYWSGNGYGNGIWNGGYGRWW
ncbi:3715_t:CDS:2, partial [Ambispora gerdemannii]